MEENQLAWSKELLDNMRTHSTVDWDKFKRTWSRNSKMYLKLSTEKLQEMPSMPQEITSTNLCPPTCHMPTQRGLMFHLWDLIFLASQTSLWLITVLQHEKMSIEEVSTGKTTVDRVLNLGMMLLKISNTHSLWQTQPIEMNKPLESDIDLLLLLLNLTSTIRDRIANQDSIDITMSSL